MKKKKGNFVPRFLKKLLVLTLLFSLTAGTVSVLPVQTEVFAAAQKKTGARKFRVQLGGTRQRYYLTKKGSTWLLTDRHGKKVTGFQYIRVPKGKELKTGIIILTAKDVFAVRNIFIR